MNASEASAVKKNDLFEGTTTIVIYICIGTVGIMGNSFVIFVFAKSAKMRKKMVNILLINQSATDLAASISLVTIGHVKSVGPVLATFSVIAADLYCKLIGSRALLWGFATCSTWNLVFVNLERYIGVSFPIWHKTSLNQRHVVGVVCFVWLFGILFLLLTASLTSKYFNGTCLIATEWKTEELSILGSVTSLIVHFIFPVIVMTFCYIFIIKILRQKTKVGPASGNLNTSGQDKMGKNVLKTLALVSLTFVVCWTPNIAVFFLYVTKINETLITTTFYHFTVYLVYLNSCLNPFIYAAEYKDFQRQMKTLCCGAASGENIVSVTASTSTWVSFGQLCIYFWFYTNKTPLRKNFWLFQAHCSALRGNDNLDPDVRFSRRFSCSFVYATNALARNDSVEIDTNNEKYFCGKQPVLSLSRTQSAWKEFLCVSRSQHVKICLQWKNSCWLLVVLFWLQALCPWLWMQQPFNFGDILHLSFSCRQFMKENLWWSGDSLDYSNTASDSCAPNVGRQAKRESEGWTLWLHRAPVSETHSGSRSIVCGLRDPV